MCLGQLEMNLRELEADSLIPIHYTSRGRCCSAGAESGTSIQSSLALTTGRMLPFGGFLCLLHRHRDRSRI